MARYPHNVKGIQILDEIVARALTDTAFRGRLLDDPTAVLRKEGLEISGRRQGRRPPQSASG